MGRWSRHTKKEKSPLSSTAVQALAMINVVGRPLIRAEFRLQPWPDQIEHRHDFFFSYLRARGLIKMNIRGGFTLSNDGKAALTKALNIMVKKMDDQLCCRCDKRMSVHDRLPGYDVHVMCDGTLVDLRRSATS